MKIAVIGAGAWGSTLAQHLYKNGHRVSVWEIEKSRLQYLQKHRHPLFFPHINLSKKIILTNNLVTACSKSDIIVLVVPAQTLRATLRQIKKLANENQIFVIANKGIEIKSGKLLSKVVRDELKTKNIVILSGPSFAKEVAKGIPTTIVAAGDKKNAEIVQGIFSTPNLRVYTNSDNVGVEIGGAVKNIIAISTGIAKGMGLGDNTAAALITRGLVEITRLGVKLGAKRETFSGLTGMGDLVMTAFSENSRNMTFGELIGKGLSLKEAAKKVGMVVEGVPTTEAVVKLSRKLKIEMPITNEVYKILFENKSPRSAILSLMSRSTKPE